MNKTHRVTVVLVREEGAGRGTHPSLPRRARMERPPCFFRLALERRERPPPRRRRCPLPAHASVSRSSLLEEERGSNVGVAHPNGPCTERAFPPWSRCGSATSLLRTGRRFPPPRRSARRAGRRRSSTPSPPPPALLPGRAALSPTTGTRAGGSRCTPFRSSPPSWEATPTPLPPPAGLAFLGPRTEGALPLPSTSGASPIRVSVLARFWLPGTPRSTPPPTPRSGTSRPLRTWTAGRPRTPFVLQSV